MKRERREFSLNFFTLSLIEVLSLLVPFLTIPILTRSISSDSYGEYLLFLSFITFGFTIIDYGVQYSGVRDLVKRRKSIKKINAIYIKYQSVRLFLCVAYISIVYFYLILSNNELANKFILFGSIYLLGYLLCSTWFFQGIGRTELILIVTLITRLSSLFIIVFFIKNDTDIILLYFATSIPMLVSGIIQVVNIKYKFNVDILRFSKNSIIIRKLKDNFNIFIGILFPNLYSTLPVIYVGTVYPMSEYAIIAIALRFFAIAITIQNVFFRSLFPVLSKIKIDITNKLIIINIIFSACIILIVYFFGEQLIIWYLGGDYSTVYDYLIIIIIGLLFSGISGTISQAYFLPNGKYKKYKAVNVKASIVSFFISFLFIFEYGLIGCAIGLTISRFLLGIYALYIYVTDK